MKKFALFILLSLSLGCIELWSQPVEQYSYNTGGSILYMAIDFPLLSRDARQNYQIVYGPIGLGYSYYGYFPGGHTSYPLIKQPQPAGIHNGGGIYVIYQAAPAQGSAKRISYAYLQDGYIVSGPSLIYLGGAGPDGFPTIDMDMETGDPFVVWHSPYANIDQERVICFSFDQYDLIGIPGLWESASVVIDNPVLGEEYIYPVVKIGPSPNPGMKRVYVVGFNNHEIGNLNPSYNAYLAYVDFSHPSDLSNYSANDWTHYEVPYMRDWAMQGIRAYSDFTVSDSGKVIITGTLYDWGTYNDPNWVEGYSDNDVLFVLVNTNYGEGSSEEDWDLYLQEANIPVENPDDYFTNDVGIPYDNLYLVPFAPRFSAVVTDMETVVFSCIYRLSAGRGDDFFPDQGYVKFLNFSFDTGEFTISDVHPRSDNPSAQPYLPWDPEGDGEWEYDNDGNLIMTYSWPVWTSNEEDFETENYVRVSHKNSDFFVVFQESIYNENNSDIYIMHTRDYGQTWLPDNQHILSTYPESDHYQAELEGIIPAYLYPTQLIEFLDPDTARIHFLFFDYQDYQSNDEDNLAHPVQNRLYSNYPNPFNPITTIRFNLLQTEKVTLSIYNIKGQLVNTLVDDIMTIGEHQVSWDGTDSNNRVVGSGVYFYILTTEDHSEIRKMVLIK
ncbi:MAG: T9SS type A sorting domain-containing protein [Candidatus Cloacimonetes bacterium]|nr:T9SS type A sorting domain-containing protein [Candidatus Cloacimonadota bacterium]